MYITITSNLDKNERACKSAHTIPKQNLYINMKYINITLLQ